MTGSASRRGFLAALTAFAGAGSAGAVAAVAPQAAESPELLAVRDKLPSLIATFEAANARRLEAMAFYEKIKPQVPADLRPENIWYRNLCFESVDDLDGKAVWVKTPSGSERPLRYLASYHCTLAIKECDGRTVRGRELRRLRQLAHHYEQAVADAKSLVNWDEVERADFYARRDIHKLTEAAFAIPARTAEGICIKARCLDAEKQARESYRAGLASPFGEDLAAEIANLLGGEA